MQQLEGEIWCDVHGCVHAETGDPYNYGPDDDHPDAVWCEPEDWRKLWIGGPIAKG